jgi:muconolactone D-isomerase
MGGNHRGRAQQAVTERLNTFEREEKAMEYLTDLATTVPEGTSPTKVDELREAETVRAAELAKAGHLVRLWRPPLGPGEWRSIGLFRAADEAELREVLASLPLHIWMKVTITPLTPHPNDPEYRARRQATMSGHAQA